MAKIVDKLKHAWNAFISDDSYNQVPAYGGSYGGKPDRTRIRFSNERSIIASIYTRIAIDVSAVSIRHVRLDDSERYVEDVDSGLNYCLKVSPNLDQTPRAFRQDMVLTMFEKGCIAVVPVITTLNPNTMSYDIKNMRVGEVVSWHPGHVTLNVYNEETGYRQDIVLSKRIVALIENPLYPVMNEQSSTLQRLIRKLNLLDVVDEQSSSGKLDIIIQLPYAIKSDLRRDQARKRRADMEDQLLNSKYGVAYSDATEKITQLNRPAENNLFNQVQYLFELLYTQLGVTPEVMNGTADEATMLNYNSRTVEPILDAFIESMHRTFLTKTAQTQRQAIRYFRDPFKLVPLSQMAEIADKFTRNEILSSNEIRAGIGFKPSKDPKADELKNSNMPAPSGPVSPQPPTQEGGDGQNAS